MRLKIIEGIEKQFEQQSDQKLLNDVTEYLVAKIKFDLPTEFLKKWMQNSGEKPLTAEAADEEYVRSEKGIRYQLIQGKIIADHDLQIKFDELKAFPFESSTRTTERKYSSTLPNGIDYHSLRRQNVITTAQTSTLEPVFMV